MYVKSECTCKLMLFTNLEAETAKTDVNAASTLQNTLRLLAYAISRSVFAQVNHTWRQRHNHTSPSTNWAT